MLSIQLRSRLSWRGFCVVCVAVAVGVVYLYMQYLIVRYMATNPRFVAAKIVGVIVLVVEAIVFVLAIRSSSTWAWKARMMSLSVLAFAISVLNATVLFVYTGLAVTIITFR